MLAMGLWNGTSLYYVLWAVYHAAGIVLSHGLKRLPAPDMFGKWWQVAAPFLMPVFILAWLSGARPVLFFVLGDQPQ